MFPMAHHFVAAEDIPLSIKLTRLRIFPLQVLHLTIVVAAASSSRLSTSFGEESENEEKIIRRN
jgi:hypothetical protein